MKNKIFKVLLILVAFTGQAVAAVDLNSCDMDMAHMDVSPMNGTQQSMDCCDENADCMMDCSMSIVYILDDVALFDTCQPSSDKVSLITYTALRRSLNSLFRPPII